MEVINSSTALLSNYEVFKLLTGLRGKSEQGRNLSGPLATITYETVKYLENTPAALQDESIIQKLMKQLEKFKLTKAEKLMLLNLRPTSAVEISLILPSTEQERLTEEQVEELLQIVSEILPEVEIKQ